MTKRSKTTLFGLLALIAAFGLILTGCPDAAGSETTKDPVPTPTDVRLTPGSHGFAYEDTVIGLAAGSKYVVRSGDSWYVTKANGTLAGPFNTPVAALADPDAATLAVAIIEPPSPAVKAITGLAKGTSYSVFLVQATPVGNNDVVINAALTGGRNFLVDATGQATTKKITFGTGASAVGGSVVVLLKAAGAAVEETGGTVTNNNRIRGATNGLTYQFSEVSGTAATFETVPAGVPGNYIVFNGIESDFVAVITASTLGTTPELGEGSQGTAAAGKITVSSGKYAVLHRGNWYAVGTGGALTGVAGPVEAAAGAITGTEITPLVNDEVYSVFLVGPLAHGEKIPTNLANTAKNAIADVSTIANGAKTFEFEAGAGAASPARATLIFLVAAPVLEDVPLAQCGTQVVKCTGIKYTAATTSGATATTIVANKDDKYFTVIKGETTAYATFTTASN